MNNKLKDQIAYLFLTSLILLQTVSSFAQDRTIDQGCPGYCRSYLDYAHYGLGKLFPDLRNFNKSYDSNELLYKITLTGLTEDNKTCEITLRKKDEFYWHLYQNIIEYKDETGFAGRYQSSLSHATKNTTFDEINEIVYFENRMPAGDCGGYSGNGIAGSCGEDNYTNATVSKEKIEFTLPNGLQKICFLKK